SMISGNKVFLLGAFVVLMLSGLFIQVSDGVLLGYNANVYDDTTGWSYDEVSYDMTNPAIYLISWLLVLVGGALVAYTSFSHIFDKGAVEPFHY
ncbi:MAG: hypothetical protein H7836_10730, partial [Magnetococcus sp. YQC-3]